MARMDDLITFARMHDLKIGTIRDLIAYRRKHDRMVEKKAELSFESRYGGQWMAHTYFNKATGDETMTLVKGRIDPSKPTLVRMHTLSIFADILGEEAGDRADLLHRSMEIIAEEGTGVIVLINRPMGGHLMSRTIHIKQRVRAGEEPDLEELRDYGVGAQILAELGVHDMVLLTNTHHSLVALEGYGLNIVGERTIAPAAAEEVH
jgi:3,4-dihydroxy 2-butanone 4-phosphate synthase/GTP cyclohydrolase II